tara:strand:+ start:3111 stop:3956 length:846 start_codon:yes stop_codon:yes gene_type:complete
MSEFNRMTIVAAAEVISDTHSHSDIDVLEVQWGISDRGGGGSKPARVVSLSKAAIESEIQVYTESGIVNLRRALVETALKFSFRARNGHSWAKLKAGLRLDGFEVIEPVQVEYGYASNDANQSVQLVRMLPADAPELDMREAESEVVQLLRKRGFQVAHGHLTQAMSAFQRGEWSSANGALRNFFESYLNEIADLLGCDQSLGSKEKRDFLGGLQPPFLLSEYNEWNLNTQKPQYVQGLMSRMHPHGGHPGLSEEEDATFRLQVNLITARLFLRRLDQGLP